MIVEQSLSNCYITLYIALWQEREQAYPWGSGWSGWSSFTTYSWLISGNAINQSYRPALDRIENAVVFYLHWFGLACTQQFWSSLAWKEHFRCIFTHFSVLNWTQGYYQKLFYWSLCNIRTNKIKTWVSFLLLLLNRKFDDRVNSSILYQ